MKRKRYSEEQVAFALRQAIAAERAFAVACRFRRRSLTVHPMQGPDSGSRILPTNPSPNSVSFIGNDVP